MSKQDVTETKEEQDSSGLPLDRRVASQGITLLEPPLASGSYGVVYHALWQGQPVAVKQFTVFTAGQDGQDFLREARLMLDLERLDSPYLMPLKKICFEPSDHPENPGHYWLVMELMPQGSLYGLLKSNPTLPWSIRYQIAEDISLGLSDLHAANILHRDLKGRNVVITADYHAQLTDFGSAQSLKMEPYQSLDEEKSTRQWIAPELLQTGALWTKKAEIHSLGMVLWELAAGREPPLKASDFEPSSAQLMASPREKIPEDCPTGLKSLIEGCWQADPSARPTAAAIAAKLTPLRLAAQIEEKKQAESTALPTEAKEKKTTLTALPRSTLALLPDYTPAIQIKTDIEQALREGLAFPNFRALLWGAPEKMSLKKDQPAPVLADWQLFWAVAEACETVLCSPHSTYAQQQQAMGDWETPLPHERVTLASLVRYGLSLPRYQQSECVTVLMRVFHRLLNPATVLPLWIRHSARQGWQILNQQLQTFSSELILPLKKAIDRWQSQSETTYIKDIPKLTDYAEQFQFFRQAFMDWQQASRDKSDNMQKLETELTQALFAHFAQLAAVLSTSETSRTSAKTQKTEKTEEKPKPPPKAAFWREFAAPFQGKTKPGEDRSQPSWFAQVADWLSTQLPAPPCEFKPFVMPTTTGTYRLGIELVEGAYRHHPFFSHWAECLRLCVGLFSEYRTELDVSGVSHFSRERWQAGSYLPDSIDTPTALIRLPARLSSAHWRYQVAPMVRLQNNQSSGEHPLDLHGALPLIDEKTHLRPHAMAMNRQWRRCLTALTMDQPAEKTPIARLQWLEGEETRTRYFSTAVTQRLFHTEGKETGQIARHTRSATPGQSNVWRLTAADAVSPLPEYADEAILAYLKVDPQHPWRQWQHLTLTQRLLDYGHTGALATLAYGQVIKGQFQPHSHEAKPMPVWLSSPAGLTFCLPEETKHSDSTADIQVLDAQGQERLARCLAQLDPFYFTQMVLLTWLLVHEDDQLRNLGFESFINTQGEERYRLIAFDTDTCLEAPWIRQSDGQIQIKLKSLLYCLDTMAHPLDETACARFLTLEPESVLAAWLQLLITAEKAADNRLPSAGFEALYQRWLRLRQVLQLPRHSDDPMAPIFPTHHLELLRLLDPPLGEAYARAAQAQTQPLKRFDRVSQDYVVMSGMRISASSGLLRGQSIAQPKATSASEASVSAASGQTPRQALAFCESYRQQAQHLTRLVTYLTQQAEQTKGNPVFEKQMTQLVGDIQELNRQMQVELEKRQQQKSQKEHAATRVSQWEPLIAPNLPVTIIVPDTKEPTSASAWQSSCVRDARPGVRWVKVSPTEAGRLSLHNGNYLIVDNQPLTASRDSKDSKDSQGAWDLTPFHQAVTPKPDAKAIHQACVQVYQQQLADLDRIHKALLETEASLMRLARQRQAQLLGRRKTSDKAQAWHELKETDSHFPHRTIRQYPAPGGGCPTAVGTVAEGKGVTAITAVAGTGRAD